MAKEPEVQEEKCPVDHATRAAWLKSNSSRPVFPGATSEAPRATDSSCDSSSIDQTPSRSSSSISPSVAFFSRFFWSSTAPAPAAHNAPHGLGMDREVSSIPRGTPVNKDTRPANSEAESEVSESGNWIYPSEKMFFEAMKRKGHKGDPADMKTIVPIHNAVNERAWKEIKEWERPWGGEQKCGGPKLDSFLGLSTAMSPRARFNTLLGYTAPFDRHDWVVDRCGTKVEYIIDFYAGRNDGKGQGKLNFYLDVRPKLNTWQGWKMRASKAFGLV